jgi:hypothetical protein
MGEEKQQTNSPLLASLWYLWAGNDGNRLLSPCGPREGHWHQQQNWNVIENCCDEKTLEIEEKTIKPQTNHTVTGFLTWFTSGGQWHQLLYLSWSERGGWRHWLGNPIAYLLPLGSAGGNENETTGDMSVSCLHEYTIGFLGCLCGYGKVLIDSYIFWCHIFNLNS